jgi:hypothetical protein
LSTIPIRAAIPIKYGSFNLLTDIKIIAVPRAIIAVGTSIIVRLVITITAPTKEPIAAAVMPSTKALILLFFAIFLNYVAGITMNK